MTNEERALAMFFKQHPAYVKDRGRLRLNIFGDVIDPDKAKGERVIAKSDCIHDLSRLRYDLPKSWEIVK